MIKRVPIAMISVPFGCTKISISLLENRQTAAEIKMKNHGSG